MIPILAASASIGPVMSFVVGNIPQLWDVLSSTITAVAVHFKDSTNDEKKALVIKNMAAWYRLIDKQFDFSDANDTFFLEQFLPDAVTWVYELQKVNIVALVQKLLSGGDALDAAEKARLQAGTLAIHIDPTMPDQPVEVALMEPQAGSEHG